MEGSTDIREDQVIIAFDGKTQVFKGPFGAWIDRDDWVLDKWFLLANVEEEDILMFVHQVD